MLWSSEPIRFENAALQFFRPSVSALSVLTGIAETDLEPVLTSLVHKEILWIQTDLRSPERGQYIFLQDLVRVVAYDRLSKKDRKARHLAIVSELGEPEAAYGPEDPEAGRDLSSDRARRGSRAS